MEMYVKVCFWIGIATLLIRAIDMASSEWPKPQKPKTLGYVVAEMLLQLAFAVWAGIALWVL